MERVQCEWVESVPVERVQCEWVEESVQGEKVQVCRREVMFSRIVVMVALLQWALEEQRSWQEEVPSDGQVLKQSVLA